MLSQRRTCPHAKKAPVVGFVDVESVFVSFYVCVCVCVYVCLLPLDYTGLECYCKETINGMTVSSCENETCVVSDTSKGRCYVERRTQESSGLDLLKYDCVEIHADEISAEGVLLNTCNITTHDGLTVFQCCMGEDLCNKNIVLPEPTTRPSLDPSSSPSGKCRDLLIHVVCMQLQL